MKYVKGTFLYVVYPMLMLGIGFFAGIESMEFFYPGETKSAEEFVAEEQDMQNSKIQIVQMQTQEGSAVAEGLMPAAPEENGLPEDTAANGKEVPEQNPMKEASARGETLSVDTKYILEETDIVNDTVVETTWRLPDKYVGMDREQFLVAMESYAAFPPLSEMERGFVGLEVLSFSREKVVVQMNYQYLQPSSSFYLAVRNNEVVVYLEDMKTIYINTGIDLETLPEDVQLEIIQMLWVEDEESLYNFLETYSS